MKKIYTSCSKCIDGIETVNIMVDGEMVRQERACTTCLGSGLSSILSLSDDLVDTINDMKDKQNDIFEKVNE